MTAALRPSGGPPYWSPGEVVTWQYVNPHGNPGQLAPVRVVRDDADGFVAWLAPGTPILHPGHPDGSDLRSTPAGSCPAGTSTWRRRIASDRVVTQDHVLDLVVGPDRNIELKDELSAAGWGFDSLNPGS